MTGVDAWFWLLFCCGLCIVLLGSVVMVVVAAGIYVCQVDRLKKKME